MDDVWGALGLPGKRGRSRGGLRAAQTVGTDLAPGLTTPEEKPVQALGENQSKLKLKLNE